MIKRKILRKRKSSKVAWSNTTLERRVMLAGDVSGFDAGSFDSATGTCVAAEIAGQQTDHGQVDALRYASRSVVFIDCGVSSIESLQDGIGEGADLVLLNSFEDGISQITRELASRRDIETVHIVSHGESGRMMLGNQVVSSDTLSANEPLIRRWRQSLAPGADIMLYGCDTGAGADGVQFAEQLAKMTGADVAASTDKTGQSTLGADWDLELNVGTIESQLVFDQQTRKEYTHAFATSILEVRAAGAANSENMSIEFDGLEIGAIANVGGDADAGSFETYTFDVGSDVTIDDVRVVFTNDLFDAENNIDRNLRVDSVTLNDVVYETEDSSVFSTGTWQASDGITPGFGRGDILHGNGYFQFGGEETETTLVTIDAQLQGDVADIELQVEGQTVKTFSLFAKGGIGRRTFTAELQGDVDPESVRVAFTDDLLFTDPISGGTIDRNVVIHSISIGDLTFDGSDPNVISTGTWLPEDGVATGFGRGNILHANGYFQYSGSTSSETEIVIDAQGFGDSVDFELQIGGETVANYALSSQAGAGSRTFVYTANGNFSPEDVRVVFTNDRIFVDPISGGTIDRNLQIFSVSIGDQVFDPFTQNVFSTGTWLADDGVQPGFGRGDFLHANGYFTFVS